jgi:type IV pilus assembly protein PilA
MMQDDLASATRNLEDTAMKQHQGFTLIELMAVIAIVSILAVLALSAYTDYTVRAKVGEGMVFAAEAKTSVSEYYYTRKKLPADNAAAGLPSVAQYELSSFNFVHFVQITLQPKRGTIAIKFRIPGSKADNKVLQLVPNTAGGIVTWTCAPADEDGIRPNFVPPNCRG